MPTQISREILFITIGNITYQLRAITGCMVSSLIHKTQIRSVPNVWIRPPFNIPMKMRFSFSNFTDGLLQLFPRPDKLPCIFMYAFILIILKYGKGCTIDRIKIGLAVIT